jgi:hypothetical protein
MHEIYLLFGKGESRRESPSKFIYAIQTLRVLVGTFCEVNKVLHAPISGTPDAGSDAGFVSWWAFSSFIYSDIDL